MMLSSRKSRLLVLITALPILGVGGWWLVSHLPRPHDQVLKEALADYARGEQAWQAKDYPVALRSWRQAVEQAAAAQKALDREAKTTPKAAAEKARAPQAEICYLWARSVRDLAFAQAALDGKPLTETLDTTTGETFRSFLSVPDPERRSFAVQMLRTAVQLAPAEPSLLRDALRTELMIAPFNWQNVHPLAQAIAKAQPGDARALYLLARYEFEQPTGPPSASLPPLLKRNPDRMAKARELIHQARKTNDVLPWRSLHLEAQIDLWRLQDARRRRQPVEARQAEADLAYLLWDDRVGAMARFRKRDAMTRLSAWDVEGILQLPQLALDQLKVAAAPDAVAKGMTLLEDYLSFCRSKQADHSFAANLLLDRVAQALASATPLLDRVEPKQWADALKRARELFGSASAAPPTPPSAWATLAQVHLLTAARRPSAAAELRKEADALLGAGACSATHCSETAAAPFHAVLAYVKIMQGAPRPTLTPHLGALAAAPSKEAAFDRRLLAALAFLQEGALDKAQDELDAAVGLAPAEQRLRLHLLNAQVQLALAGSDRALPLLRLLAQSWEEDEPSLTDCLWFLDALETPAQLDYLIASTHLELARDKLRRFHNDKPSAEPPTSLTEIHEKEAAVLARRLASGSRWRLYLSQAKIRYLLEARRFAEAEREENALRKDWPDTLGAYAARLLVARRSNKGLKELEAEWSRAQEEKPQDAPLRTARALLLIHTQRLDAARQMFAALPSDAFGLLAADQLPVEEVHTLGRLAAELSEGLAMQLRPVFAAALRRQPNDPRLVLLGAQAQWACGDGEAARRSCERVVRLCASRAYRLENAERQALTEQAKRLLDRIN